MSTIRRAYLRLAGIPHRENSLAQSGYAAQLAGKNTLTLFRNALNVENERVVFYISFKIMSLIGVSVGSTAEGLTLFTWLNILIT
ncbi:hypothetical protein ACQK5W_03560 [Pantoea sp. FN060301]|uniref:hypothetical protein n=1 Tax=Pantoea sp. FN060301 TaxID=3420380 RepID=UPI003D17BD13